MRVLISVDMEGIAGVVSTSHTGSAHKDYERFRRLMTEEANAAVEGALAGGADVVTVTDAHGSMTNILIEELNPAAELISGSPKPLVMMEGITHDTDAVFFIGYHASAGTGSAGLSHTSSSAIILEASLNGQVLGETGFNAAIAGAFGAPVVLVTGDLAVTEEAHALLGEIETVAVKQGLGWCAAKCITPAVARKSIREAAERSLQCQVNPFIVEPPITVSITFFLPVHADLAAVVPGSLRVDGRTVQWTGQDMPTVYSAYRAMMGLASSWKRPDPR